MCELHTEGIDPVAASAYILAFGTDEQKKAWKEGFREGFKVTEKKAKEIAEIACKAIKESQNEMPDVSS